MQPSSMTISTPPVPRRQSIICLVPTATPAHSLATQLQPLPSPSPQQHTHRYPLRSRFAAPKSSSALANVGGSPSLPMHSHDRKAEDSNPPSPWAWLSRLLTVAGQQERLHYHPNGGRHQHSHHHHHHHHHNRQQQPQQQSIASTAASARTDVSSKVIDQLFVKATVVTLESKYSTVPWAAEFYCTFTSPFFALPLMLYLDPGFRWSAPDIHIVHFTIALSCLTALISSLYHATLFKLFSSMDACFATIMFYLNTLVLVRSLPLEYALLIPEPISTIVAWDYTSYTIALIMCCLFLYSWQKTAMLSLLLMVMMIPPSICGFVAHEQWWGLVFGIVGLAMFAADRFHLFCGHSWWHLAGGLSLYFGLASGALIK